MKRKTVIEEIKKLEHQLNDEVDILNKIRLMSLLSCIKKVYIMVKSDNDFSKIKIFNKEWI